MIAKNSIHSLTSILKNSEKPQLVGSASLVACRLNFLQNKTIENTNISKQGPLRLTQVFL